jgi:hypothetical protein
MRGTPHPRYFAQRVRICLIVKDLTFARATKSSQEYRNKGVSRIGKGSRRVTCRANMTESIILVYALSRSFLTGVSRI